MHVQIYTNICTYLHISTNQIGPDRKILIYWERRKNKQEQLKDGKCPLSVGRWMKIKRGGKPSFSCLCSYKKKKKCWFWITCLISTCDSGSKSQLIIHINPGISAVMATDTRATVSQMRIKKPEWLFLQSEALPLQKGANTGSVLQLWEAVSLLSPSCNKTATILCVFASQACKQG